MEQSNVDLEKFSLVDLIALKTNLDDTITKRREQEKNDLRKKITDLVNESGFTFAELFGESSRTPKKPVGKKGAVAIKYQNPENPSQTWTGRGAKPAWIREYVAQGNSLDGVLVSHTVSQN